MRKLKLNFKKNGTFSYIHNFPYSRSYDSFKDSWHTFEDSIIISFNDGYHKLKGKLIMDGRFLVGNSENEKNLKGSWVARRIS